ncbi:MAG: 23S rRNA (uracil(1939)-C(5))-methyltransferase RlmD, partial [Balneolaceae bacterium]
LHAPGRYDKILDLKECHLQIPESYQILEEVRRYCIEKEIPAYDTSANKGFMRHLVIRNSHYSGDLMVNLVTNSYQPERIGGLADHLLATFGDITTIVNNINDKPNPTAVGREEHVLYGPGIITDSIGGHVFEINPNAFFQTNTLQAEKLYRIALDLAGLQKHDILYDLYCGVGTLSLFASDSVRKVIGIELVGVAVKNAIANAAANQVQNAEFHKGDMKEALTESLLEKAGRPDCIITDPPRSGMHPDVVKQLAGFKVPRLIYISCNPSTMARDLKVLGEAYKVEKIQPVDMFPQTYHIEAVAGLTRR